jgi:hypothetical protein
MDQTTRADPGWYADADQPGRERWWDGQRWTARVLDHSEAGTDERIAWALNLLERPAPPIVTYENGEMVIDLTGTGPVTAPVGAMPPLPPLAPDAHEVPTQEIEIEITVLPGGAPGAHAPSRFLAPAPQTFPRMARVRVVHDPQAATEAELTRARRRRFRRRLVAVAAAIIVVLGAAAASAVILEESTKAGAQPIVLRDYRDDAAGFALSYPRAWHIDEPTPGEGVRFAVGPLAASPSDTNTVSVVVGENATELPALNNVADEVADRLRRDHDRLELTDAEVTRLADRPAFHLRFNDGRGASRTKIEQFVARTASGHPLTVTITVNNADTAPTPRAVRAFLQSVQST